MAKQLCPFILPFLFAVLASAQEAAVPGPETRVAQVQGAPAFFVDGTPFFTPSFETYVPLQKYFEQFAAAGVKLYCFNTNAGACDYGHSRNAWIAPDQWDFSDFDERFDRVLAADPDALLMPRVYIGTPAWWLEANPGEMEILNDGSTLYKEPNRNPTIPKGRPFPSIVSEKWRHDMGEGLKHFLEHVQQSKYAAHIFGYFLTGLDTEEWYHWGSGSEQLAGYSAATTQSFRRWLTKKYGSDAGLRQAWGREVTLDTAQTPAFEERYDAAEGTFRDPAKKMNVIDFYQFYNEIVPETIDYFARIAREATQGKKVLGGFYGYMYEFGGDPEFGHNALWRYNKSKNLDCIFVTASYAGRAPGTGGDYARSPSHSVRLHNKLWYHDNDVVSYLAPEVMKRVGLSEAGDWSTSLQHHLKVLGYTETAEQTGWMYRRSLGFALCNGMYESFFDLHGGYYDAPDLMQEVARLNRAAEIAGALPRGSVSEILVLADEASCAYPTFRSGMMAATLADTQQQLIKIGAPADHVLLSDLELLDVAPYKFVVMLNCWHMTTAQRELVQAKLLNSGRQVLWCYAPGYFNENTRSESAMRELTGMKIVVGTQTVSPQVEWRDPAFTAMPAAGPQVQAQVFSVEDDSAETLGVLPGTEIVAMAEKQMDGWRSVYSITAGLPAAAFRALARQAGVHLYNERDDTLYANESLVTVHANGAGTRTLRFPSSCAVWDLMSGKQLTEAAKEVTLDLQQGETVILRYEEMP